mmetsp:Transcript_966/g.928  ORF Transcript_966/g.928 Transcript_966/m.928 type:complete len:128 (+) Transcript_966:700-1083(+)
MLDKVTKGRVDIATTSKPSQDKITVLTNKLAQAIAENKDLNSQLEMTQNNVKSFISEMTTLISSKDFSQMMEGEIANELFEEESGGSKYGDDQREDYQKPSKKYTPHYHTATQGGIGVQAKGKRKAK